MGVNATIIDKQGVVRNAEAAVWSGERVWKHVRSEFTNDIDALMSTIATEVPLQYAVPGIDPSGGLFMVTVTTRDGALEHYKGVRAVHDIVDWQAFLELRNDWCVFFEGVVTQRLAGSHEIAKGHAVVLFVLSEQEGITGELAWSHDTREAHAEEAAPAGSTNGQTTLPLRRLENLAWHARYLDILKAGNYDSLMALMREDIDVGTRNYLTDDPAFVNIKGKEALGRHYREFPRPIPGPGRLSRQPDRRGLVRVLRAPVGGDPPWPLRSGAVPDGRGARRQGGSDRRSHGLRHRPGVTAYARGR